MRVGIRSILASGKICRAMLLGLVAIGLVIPGGDVALSQSGTGSSSSTPTPFDYPNALSTFGLGINSTGQIVGYFFDTSNNIHGFLRNADGTFPFTVDVQNSTLTAAYGINGTGLIVGYFADSSRHYHGFLRYANGTFAPTIDAPNSIQTYAYGINGTGQIAGTFVSTTSTSGGACEFNPHQAGCTHGFLRSADGTTFTPIDVPGSVETDAYGINGSGQVVGYFYDTSGNLHGFLRYANGTNFLTIDVQNSTYTQAFGINDTGQIVGAFASTSAVHGFLRDATSGTSTPFDAPSATNTDGFGINGSGLISGYFYDASLKVHGFFMGKPDPQLKVPHWYQAGIPGPTYPGNFWGPDPYDFEIPVVTIEAKGCAITALTMLADFWEGQKAASYLTDPTPSTYTTLISPLDLSFIDEGLFLGHTGDVIFDNFAKIARTTQLVRVYQACPNNTCPTNLTSPPSNSFPVIGNPPDAKLTLDNLLRNNIPVILPIFEDGNTKDASHFVVVTGKQNGTYLVNDPGDVNMKTLDQLPTSFWAIGKGTTAKPQHTVQIATSFDVNKYIVFVDSLKAITLKDPNTAQALGIYSDAPGEFVLTDPQGRRTGFDPVANTSFQEIPTSAYSSAIFRDEQNFSSVDPPPLKALDLANQMAGQYTLNVIGTGSGDFTVLVMASDASGAWIAQTYSGTTAPGASSQFTFQGAVTTLAAFSANVAINNSKNQFAVGGQFTLGTGSPGMNPLTQPVTLQVGAFLITIPAGSFHLDSHGNYVFQGTINGVQLAAGIQPQGGNQFAYGIAGQNSTNLPTTNPVNVRLAIGNNGGSTLVNANFLQ